MLFVDRKSRPRGGELAYLNDPGLSRKQKRAARAMNAAYYEATPRGAVIAIRVSREEKGKLKQRKAEQEREP